MRASMTFRGRRIDSARGIRAGLAVLVFAVMVFVPVGARASQQATQAPPARASFDRLLANFATWDGGIASEARWALRDYVQEHRDDPAGRQQCEAALVRFLSGKATGQAKMEAARHLRLVAGEGSIAPLAALIGDARTADYAIYALQPVPGDAVDRALLRALAERKTPLPIRKALVASLGQRRSAVAVPSIAALTADRDLGAVAVVALGRIGDAPSRDALMALWVKAAAPVKGALASALLSSAERAIQTDSAAALRIYETVAAEATVAAPIRRGANLGRIDASGPSSASVLVEMLEGGDDVARDAAIARLRTVVPAEGLAPVCAVLPRLPDGFKVQLLAALGDYPAERVRPTAIEAVRREQGAVRIAALKALGRVGAASEVGLLVDLAATARGDEQAAARAALASLKGREVDAAIVSALEAKPAAAAEAELLLTIGERRIFAAKPAVASRVAAAGPPRVLREALRTLRAIGTPSDIPVVLDVLVAASADDLVADAELTVNALASKMAAVNARSMPIRLRLRTAKEPAVRARLLSVLPLTGDGTALTELRAALGDSSPEVADAAARAIAAWPTASAHDDIRQMAKEAKDETHKLLAIQALVRLLTLDTSRQPAAAVADLRDVAGMASRSEERRLVLGALAQFPSAEALEAAKGFLSDDSVKAEAQAAVESITTQMKRPWMR